MKPGVLVISHGSREAEWVRLVDEAVDAAAASVRDSMGRHGAPRDTTGELGDSKPEGLRPNAASSLQGSVDAADDAKGPAAAQDTAADIRGGSAAGARPGWAAVGPEQAAAGGHESDEGRLPVVSSFLEIVEGRLIQDGIDRLEAEGVTDLYVLPLFVSSGSTHVDDIAQAFGLPPVSAARPGEIAPFRLGGMRVHFGQPIDDDADIAELLLANIRELSAAPERERLLLVAHGSREAGFFARWRGGMTLLAERMRQRGGFAGADIAMLLPDQAACKLRALQRKRPEETIIVVPLFLSIGYFTRTVIPTRLQGLDYRYNGRAMLPSPHILRWMRRQMTSWLEMLDRNRIE